jgi:hypothetical protein
MQVGLHGDDGFLDAAVDADGDGLALRLISRRGWCAGLRPGPALQPVVLASDGTGSPQRTGMECAWISWAVRPAANHPPVIGQAAAFDRAWADNLHGTQGPAAKCRELVLAECV